MTAHILAAPVRYWKCPECDATAKTQIAEAHGEFHYCPALGIAHVPLIEVPDPDAKVRGRQVVVQSEYGPEVAAVRTERADGSNDVTVFPRPATSAVTSEGVN